MAIDITNSAEYTEVISKINLWYGNDAQRVIDLANQYELTPEQLTQDWLSGTGYEPWYTSSGAIGGYNSVGTSGINYAAGMQEAANSNAGSVTQVALKTPVEQTINQSGKVVTTSGLTSVATGLKSGLTFVTKEVLPAVSAAGLGITLGKKIDSALYNLNPDFWDNIGMATLNPETWNSITQDYPDGFLKKAFNTVFGLDPNTGETQLYLDENAAAYLAMYMDDKGVFNTGDSYIDYPSGDHPTVPEAFAPPYPQTAQIVRKRDMSDNYPNQYTYFNSRGVYLAQRMTGGSTITIGASETSNADVYTTQGRNYISGVWGTPIVNKATLSYRYAGKTAYYNAIGTTSAMGTIVEGTPKITGDPASGGNEGPIAWILLYGTYHSGASVEGITDQDGATLPDFSNCTTPADYLQALKNQYPDLFNNAVSQTIVNPDGTSKTTNYLPIGTSSKNNNGNKTQPITDTQNSGNTQSDTTANPTTLDLTGLENLIKTITDSLTGTGTPTNPVNPDPTGTGNTPPVVVPTGNASALWSVYNPSQAELNSFGAWLWSSNFIDQILKLFNNPMQSIIGVHKIFATPAISGSGTITVGYLSSGVSANLVSNQYTDIDCGTVNVREQFGNVFDYTDTHIRLYLPFIGIVDLDTSDVMRGAVKVVYHVDVITGACLAEVKVTRDSGGGTLYQYAGDAAVRYPISSGSYMGVVSGILSAVGGVASAVMTGGATLPLAAGAVAGGISGAHTQVQHSGNFSGNAGAMGGKKPYLIIERPQSYIADDFKHWQGLGANTRRTVGQMSGYFKFSDVHTESISKASESEIETIRAALESGVIA